MILKTLITASLLTATAIPAMAMQNDAKPQEGHAVEAHAAKNAEMKLTLSVTGLTAENASKVELALSGLEQKLFACPGCDATQPAAGKCKRCDKELAGKDVAIFQAVTASDANKAIDLRLNRATNIRLSQVDKALSASSVTVDRKHLELGPHSFLVYGAESEADAKTIEAAFKAAKIADVRATFVPAKHEVHVTVPSGKTTYAKFEEIGSKSDKPLKLIDVMWGRSAVPMG